MHAFKKFWFPCSQFFPSTRAPQNHFICFHTSWWASWALSAGESISSTSTHSKLFLHLSIKKQNFLIDTSPVLLWDEVAQNLNALYNLFISLRWIQKSLFKCKLPFFPRVIDKLLKNPYEWDRSHRIEIKAKTQCIFSTKTKLGDESSGCRNARETLRDFCSQEI